jgi:hypothetical protein
MKATFRKRLKVTIDLIGWLVTSPIAGADRSFNAAAASGYPAGCDFHRCSLSDCDPKSGNGVAAYPVYLKGPVGKVDAAALVEHRIRRKPLPNCSEKVSRQRIVSHRERESSKRRRECSKGCTFPNSAHEYPFKNPGTRRSTQTGSDASAPPQRVRNSHFERLMYRWLEHYWLIVTLTAVEVTDV